MTLDLSVSYCLICLFFFFQAEDGIRDWSVTEFRRVLFRSGVGGVDVGGAHPRSVSTCTSCCNISLESVGLVLDTGADPGVEWLRSSVRCSSSVQLLDRKSVV